MVLSAVRSSVALSNTLGLNILNSYQSDLITNSAEKILKLLPRYSSQARYWAVRNFSADSCSKFNDFFVVVKETII